jgi:hypothetical protein
MLINWPSGVGQLSPGWVQAVYLGAVVRPIVDAGVVDSGTPVIDAGTTTPDAGLPKPDAGTTTDGGARPRPIIKLPVKK